ncbi:MAG TPA: alpha/beta fold hydrolase [Anaeromyxobacter sp.]|nr:alpha/beta fold hydrolase [Anaeromyxobacter sp.]
MSVLSVAAVAAALSALLLLHYALSSLWLRVPAREDELLFARTRDGWELALGRCRPKGRARALPVLLVPGVAMNRQAFEFGLSRYALAAHLAVAGFDCFSLDLRGHGASHRLGPGAPRSWNLDTYLDLDLPAAFERIRRETGAPRVLYVGHSQGALLGLAAAARYGPRIAALAALAAPAHFDVQGDLKVVLSWRYPLRGRLTRTIARMVAPFSGYWHPAPADLALNLRNVEPAVLRRLLASAVENVAPGVLEQFETFVREDSFRSMDGEVDYRAMLPGCRQPALFLAAEKDGLAPPSVVRATYESWGGPKRYVLERDFGHADLLVGRDAPEVVYPEVRRFLEEQAAGPGA